MNFHKTLTYGSILAIAGCLCCLFLAGCSSEPAGGAAHLAVYHQDPNQPSPADQAAASMAKRHYGVQNTQSQGTATTSTKP